MKKLEELFGEFEARVAQGILFTLHDGTVPMKASHLVKESTEEVKDLLKNPHFNPRVADYEGMFMQLNAGGYVIITDSTGEQMPAGVGVAESNQVQFTEEGKSFFEQTYMVAQ